MATETREPEASPQSADPLPPSGVERAIDGRLRTTRAQVKTIEVVTRVVALVCAALVYLLLATLIDHWIVPGGIGLLGRSLLFLGLVGGATAYLMVFVFPLFLRRVNPVFAALAIEQNQPSLKNSLVNFLLLRRRHDGIAPVVYNALGEKAAEDLRRVPVEGAVDRSPLVKIGYILLAVVAILGLYIFFSPKNLFQSMRRVVAPWSNVAAPTRVAIDDLRPGDTRAFFEEQLMVSAVVRGIDDGEAVELFWTTDDRRVVEHPIRMVVPPGAYRFEAMIPDSGRGLQRSGEYYLAAGDARSPTYRIEVLTAPAILVERALYRYPTYTRLGETVVEREGDLRAIDGTSVLLTARSNREMAAAWVDLGCDGRGDLPMEIDARQATVEFDLRLGEDGRPQYDSYQLLFTSEEGHENPRPIRHRIFVAPDERPQIRFLEPRSDRLDVPLAGSQELVVSAIDPDFALARVRLRIEQGTRQLSDQALLDAEHTGEFQGEFVFRPSEYELKAGDEVVYWAEAFDNRQPNPGTGRTPARQMRIVESPEETAAGDDSSEQQPGDQDKQPQDDSGDSGDSNGSSREQPAENRDGSNVESDPGDPSEAGRSPEPDAGGNEGEASNEGAQEPERIDPESNPGDAFEKILEHRQEQQPGEQQPNDQTSDPSQPEHDDQGGSAEDSSDEQGASQPDDAQSDPAQQHPENDSQGGASESQPQGADDSGQGDQGQPEGAAGADGAEGQKPGDKSSDQGAKAPQEGDNRSAPQPGEGDRPSDKQPPPGAGKRGDTSKGKPSDRPSQDPTAEENRPPQPGGGTEQSKSGQGDRAQPTSGKEPMTEGERPDSEVEAEGSDQADPKGPPGAGQSEANEKGSPTAQELSRPRPKEQRTGDSADERPREDQPSAQSKSPRESDSQGADDGERSGGGQQGGGQQADKPGTGGAGRNSAADEGAGAAPGKGKGPTGDKPGGESPSSADTGGEQSPTPGSGSESDSGEEQGGAGRQPPASDPSSGAKQGQPEAGARPDSGPPSGDSGEPKPSDRNPSDSSGSNQAPPADQKDGSPSPSGDGGGQPGQPGSGRKGPASGSDAPQQESPEREFSPQNDRPQRPEEPNLDYARKATDLAIEHLEDQLDKGQDELLDELGWTREDALRFVERWREMRRQAAARNQPAPEQFEEALRSLGLRPGGTGLRGGRTRERRIDRPRETIRTRAPAEYRDQVKAFTEGTARSRGSRGEP